MNFSETYQRINNPIAPSPALIEATLAKARRRVFPLRRLAAAAAAAAVILATPALAAQTEPGYQLLYAVSPAAAQFFQPVQMSCASNGVTMEVLSVRVEGDTAQAYIALSGEPVDGACDLFDSYSFHLPFDQTGHCEPIGYDPETRTAVFLCTTKTMDGSPIPAEGKMTFSASCFLTGKEARENLAVDLTLAGHAVPAQTAEEYFLTGGGYSDETGRGLLDRVPMLLPGPPLVSFAEELSITAAGYAEELFHIQVCRGDAAKLDNHAWLWLEDENGNRLECVCVAYFTNFSEQDDRLDYQTFLFDVAPEELSAYTLHGDFFIATARIDGNWRVTFPLKNTVQD